MSQNTPGGADWLTARETAWRMGVHQETVLKWCRDGKVQAQKTPGGHWRVHPGIAPPVNRCAECGRPK